MRRPFPKFVSDDQANREANGPRHHAAAHERTRRSSGYSSPVGLIRAPLEAGSVVS